MERLTLNYFRILFLMSALPLIRSFLPFIPPEILGFNLSGWAWIGVFLTSVVYLFILKRITFPVWIWIPWMAYLSFYIVIDFSFYGLQLTLQYFVAILVGVVVSGLKYNQFIIKKISKWFFLLVVYFQIGILYFYILTFNLPDMSFGPAQVMTFNVAAALLLSVFFVTKNKKSLYYYFIIAIFPIIQVTRMGVLLIFAIAPLHFANKKVRGKLIVGGLVTILGLMVFYSSTFQKKTFFSGQGNLTEVVNFKSNDDFDTSGRKTLYEIVDNGIKEKPLFGHGPRADLNLLKYNDYQITEVHNDFLSVQYNYGAVGLFIIISTFIFQFIHFYNRRNKLNIKIYKILMYAALTLFIPLIGFMYSDNVLKYSIYFGNFHFIMMGICYSLLYRKEQINKLSRIKQSVK